MKCCIDNCTRTAIKLKMCELHYRRTRKWGSAGGAELMREYHGKYYSPEYRAWSNMLTRCYNPKRKDYDNYGGRGIGVCNEWRESFSKFYAYMGDRPSANHSIDRIDVQGNYEPGNVRWSNRTTQNRNQRSRRNKTGYSGVYKTGNRYMTTICIDRKVKYLGTFDTPELAHAEYKKAKQEHHTI